MNELTNFCNGRCETTDNSIYDYLPYLPTGAPLNQKTISMDIEMYDQSIQFNSHSINNGFLEVIASHEYLSTTTPLPFVLTRQNSPGTGRYAAHWTGDNISSFKFMGLSIPGILSAALFGIPFTGADICGFGGNTTENLCARWAQLGAWYPFSRNHNHIDSISQEFYALGATVETTARESFKLRYALLKHLYSKFVKKAGVGMVYQPIFFADPNDLDLMQADLVDSAFLIDNETLVFPVLLENSYKASVVFPRGNWFFLNGTVASASPDKSNQTLVESPLNATALAFVRSGSIVSMQDVKNVTKTIHLDNTFDLLAYLDSTSYSASGSLLGVANYTDEAVVKESFENKCITEFSVAFSSELKGTLSLKTTQISCEVDFVINSLTIYLQTNCLSSSTFTLSQTIKVGSDTISLAFECDESTNKCSLDV